MNGSKKPKIVFGRQLISITLAAAILTVLFVALQNFTAVRTFVKNAINILTPFLWGLALAYLLNLLVKLFEKRLLHFIKIASLKRGLAVVLSLLVALLLLAGLVFLIVPQVVSSVSTLISNFSYYFRDTESSLSGIAEKIGLPGSLLEGVFGSLDDLVELVTGWTRDIAPKVLNYSLKVGSWLLNTVLAVFTAIYILFDRERLVLHTKLVLKAFCSETTYQRIAKIARSTDRAIGGFLIGKSIDSLIIGVLCFIFCAIFKMPFALLVSVIVGVTNIVPTIGPFIGAIPSAFIILIVDPIKGLWFIVFIILLQQFDGNFLGPHILSDTIGLSALWILFSVVVFGAIWGIVGMVVGVPLFAVIYDLIAEYIKKRVANKQTSDSSEI